MVILRAVNFLSSSSFFPPLLVSVDLCLFLALDCSHIGQLLLWPPLQGRLHGVRLSPSKTRSRHCHLGEGESSEKAGLATWRVKSVETNKFDLADPRFATRSDSACQSPDSWSIFTPDFG
jgi:hypothetical protein